MSERDQMKVGDSAIKHQAQPSGLSAADLFRGSDWSSISGSRGTSSEHLPPCHLMPIEEPRDGTPYHERPVTPCNPNMTPPASDSGSIDRNIPTPPYRPEYPSQGSVPRNPPR